MNSTRTSLAANPETVAPQPDVPPQPSLLSAQKQALEMVVTGAPLRDILSYLTRIVEEQAGGSVVAAILLLDADGRLHTGAGPSLPDAYNAAIDGLKARRDLGTCSVAAVTGEVVVTPDIDADPKWASIKHLPLDLGLKAAWSQPIIDRNGRVLGTFGTYFRECRPPRELERQLVEVLSHTAALAIERKRTDDDREQQTRILDTALDAAGMGTWRYTLADNICLCSPRAVELYGLSAPEWQHDEEGVRQILHPDDIAPMEERLAEACDPEGTGRYSVEYRVRRRDGGWRWLSVWAVVEFEEGEQRRAVALTGASRDVTDQKEAEQQQELLINELNHRVKNTLAIIQSISSQTLRNAADPAAFREAFSDRLSALARAHSLLTSSLWKKVSFSEIASTILSPYMQAGAKRVRLEGPPASVPANTAVTLSLVLHELATNAAKHGALSGPEGHVSLSWHSRDNGSCGMEMVWREHDGPAVASPARSGFGSKLLKASAEQLGGEVDTEFAAEGLRCRFRFVLSNGADRDDWPGSHAAQPDRPARVPLPRANAQPAVLAAQD